MAVVGLPGSGKTEAVNYIIRKVSWPKVYFGQITFDEMASRGLGVNESNERAIREELRTTYGMDVFAKRSLPKIRNLYQTSSVVLESLYSWEEYRVIKEEFGDAFQVLAIYASPAIRAARLMARAQRPLTAAEVQSRDYAQIENLHQAGPIARADYTVLNEGSLQDLQTEIDEVINAL